HPGAALTRGGAEDQVDLIARRQREQEILGLAVGKEPEALEPIVGRENGPGLLELAREQRPLARLTERGRVHARLPRSGPARAFRCATDEPPRSPGPADTGRS